MRLVMIFVLAAPCLGPATVQPIPVAPYTDAATPYTRFSDATVTLPDRERVTRFHAEFDPLLPGFYQRATRRRQRALDAAIARALRRFPETRATFVAATAGFAPAFAAAQGHFRATFPDYTLGMPVYLIQSFGQMDGGTRTIGGRPAMLFGADMIAQLHDETTIGPFLDHELFHIYHARFFPDCAALWCSLWQEGLAVHAAALMNPGASDRQLELVYPRPIRPEIEGRIPAAMCFLRTHLDSTRTRDYAPLFLGQPNKTGFPPRFGYLLGQWLAEKVGAHRSLQSLAQLPPDQVRPLLLAALQSYGPC